MAKIKKDELSKVQDLTKKYNDSLHQLGILQINQQEVLKHNEVLREELEVVKKELQESYGDVEINISDGEIVEVAKDVEDKKD
jgi:regulator of replication initiation timing